MPKSSRKKNSPRPSSLPKNRVILAAPERDANLFWATGFLAPDPVIFVEQGKKRFLILNDLEVDRGRQQAKVDKVLSYSALESQIKKTGKTVGMLGVLAHFLQKNKIKEVGVPYNFPLAYAQGLKKLGIQSTCIAEPFYPQRLIKTAQEKAAIKKTLHSVSLAIQEAYEVLKQSEIRKNRLYWQGSVLTSERLRAVINLSLMKNNCLGKHTIVACGDQGVDPHCEGSGPLIPHQAIIMDVFPQSMDSQYFGDMTRTVVKGKASEALRRQWNTVKYAQEQGIKKIKAGIDGQSIHEWIQNYFEGQGYETGIKDGRMQGFFHGTGHGLGIEIHEAPRISKVSSILQAGTVVTVEPGLYYQGVGGVRIEDVVYVTPQGCEVLSRCPKILEIA